MFTKSLDTIKERKCDLITQKYGLNDTVSWKTYEQRVKLTGLAFNSLKKNSN